MKCVPILHIKFQNTEFNRTIRKIVSLNLVISNTPKWERTNPILKITYFRKE